MTDETDCVFIFNQPLEDSDCVSVEIVSEKERKSFERAMERNPSVKVEMPYAPGWKVEVATMLHAVLTDPEDVRLAKRATQLGMCVNYGIIYEVNIQDEGRSSEETDLDEL